MRQTGKAGRFHQLGRVAGEQRRWAEAEQHYRKALEIYVEFDDRYEQASTYHQLGTVAQAQRRWAEARDSFLKALEILLEFDDQHDAAITLRSLARLWRASGDDGIPAAAAARLGTSPEEAAELLRTALEE